MTLKDEKEWILQAEDDLKSAEVLLKGARYTHCVFFCHLSIEKALKAVYVHKFKEDPPRTHNLTMLLNEIDVRPPKHLLKLIDRLATASVPTRYPEDLRWISEKYTKANTPEIVKTTRMVVSWIREHLGK